MYMYVGYIWCPIPRLWFWVIACTLQNFQFYDLQNTTHSTVFIRFQPNFMRTLLTMGECKLLLFLAISQVLHLWHFEILTLESMGKPKIWNILKTADRRPKRIIDHRAKQKLWHFEIFLNTGPYAAGNFKVQFLPQFSLEPIQTLIDYDNIGDHGKSKCLLE